MEWEVVIAFKPGTMESGTCRLKIPEGWLYRYGSQMVFVPDQTPSMSNTWSPTPYGMGANYNR